MFHLESAARSCRRTFGLALAVALTLPGCVSATHHDLPGAAAPTGTRTAVDPAMPLWTAGPSAKGDWCVLSGEARSEFRGGLFNSVVAVSRGRAAIVYRVIETAGGRLAIERIDYEGCGATRTIDLPPDRKLSTCELFALRLDGVDPTQVAAEDVGEVDVTSQGRTFRCRRIALRTSGPGAEEMEAALAPEIPALGVASFRSVKRWPWDDSRTCLVVGFGNAEGTLFGKTPEQVLAEDLKAGQDAQAEANRELERKARAELLTR